MKVSRIVLFFLFLSIAISSNAQYDEFKVTVSGSGPPILLIPGFTCTGEVWNETVAQLNKNYECHIFTLAGFGDVPAIELPWLPKIKDALLNYVKEKELDKATIIGHSLGGSLALWMASEEGILFKKLIVVDALPSIGALMIPNFEAASIVYDNPYSNNVLNMDGESFKTMATQMASYMSLNKELHSRLTDWIIKSDREIYVHGYTDLLKLDLREAIKKIEIPVTILAATYPNKEMILLQYEKQYKNLPQKNILYAENSAHFIMYDQPEWFMKHISSELIK
ncbi:alpha/beta fold hydrolase [Ascidiimonas sp. W6]|uniref:alpha/beta fold hydrolase n=1 Tax=Ascidiimonas meishanensis TaxID=3128903 RepID=UPI0030EBE076